MERHSSETPLCPFTPRTPMSPVAPAKRQIVVVLGGSFSGTFPSTHGSNFVGAHCAHMLAKTLPPSTLLLLIEQSSHMIHRFVLPRYSVYPSHEHKAFIPYSELLHNNEHDANSHQHPLHCESRVIQARALRITNGHIDLDRPVKGFGTRVQYNYLVYALGAKLPGFLSSVVDSDKGSSISWVQSLQVKIAKSTNVVVVGGGALGIQFASDIKERFPEKKVKLIHSRDRFLPLYDSAMHDRIFERLHTLGVEMFFNDRVTSSLSIIEGQHIVTTRSGLHFDCDLQLNCTGLQYNSALLASMSPQSLNLKNSCLHVLPTMQLADSRYENIYVIGDVADTAALKNAVSGWFQGEVVARNITRMVRKSDNSKPSQTTPSPSLPPNHGQSTLNPIETDELESYVPGPPVIKLTVGKQTYLYQRPKPESLEPEVGFYEANEDLDAAVTWTMYGADTGDLFA